MKLNKAAMFGLYRALKKQSRELFLASRQSVVSQETRGSFKATRAAMFGLDARIALAIFGALSVISGAALYSAIQEAKVTALLTEMQEIGKSWEQYLLDTGTDLPAVSGKPQQRDMSYLVTDNSISGWNGPYLNYAISSTNVNRLAHGSYGDMLFIAAKDVEWGNTALTAWSDHACSSNDTDCRNWVLIFGIENQSIVENLDLKVDGLSDDSNGNFRWYYVDDANKYRALLNIAPYQNP